MQHQHDILWPHHLSSADREDDYFSAADVTPLRPDAFPLSDEEKVRQIFYHFKPIMHTSGLNLTDVLLAIQPIEGIKINL
jgi:GTP cyclohydrolase IA